MVRLPKMPPEIELDIALHRGEFVAASALMNTVACRWIWKSSAANKQTSLNAVRDALVPR